MTHIETSRETSLNRRPDTRLRRYEEAVLRESRIFSTQYNRGEKIREISQMQRRRNRIRMWSYKAVGLLS